MKIRDFIKEHLCILLGIITVIALSFPAYHYSSNYIQELRYEKLPEEDQFMNLPKEAYNFEYKKAGNYKIGETLAPGEYIIVGNGYLDCMIDDELVYRDHYIGQTYITVENNQVLSFTDGKLYNINKGITIPKVSNPDNGMYKIGTDFPKGDYIIKYTDDNSGVLVSKDSKHDLKSIIKRYFKSDGTEITLKNGQYITLINATITKK